MKTQNTRTFRPSAWEALRRRVVQAVVDQGLSRQAAARTFGVNRTSVHAWAATYPQGGASALRSDHQADRSYLRSTQRKPHIASLILPETTSNIRMSIRRRNVSLFEAGVISTENRPDPSQSTAQAHDPVISGGFQRRHMIVTPAFLNEVRHRSTVCSSVVVRDIIPVQPRR